MSGNQNHVTIKGVNDGLVFIMDDSCDFEMLLSELQYKLSTSHEQILSGPDIPVKLELGDRRITLQQKEQLLALLGKKKNLIIQSVDHMTLSDSNNNQKNIAIMKGIVRSGQTVMHDASLLFIGDVNPGGIIISHGDIYVLGSLRGMAHAGASGDENAVIAASSLRPTQLRIAERISRPPDEWGVEQAAMEFAYIVDGKMEIDKISKLHRIRPDITEFKGE